MDKKFEFEVIEHIASLSDEDSIVLTELNIVKWGNAEPKYDIRHWRLNAFKENTPYKGISLSAGELRELKAALNNMEI